MEKEEKIKLAIERLDRDYSFNPSKKTKWVNELIEGGLTEKEARYVFKIMATRYYFERRQSNEQRHKEFSPVEKIGKAGLTIGSIFLTFWLGPLMYLILVSIVIAILSFIFSF